MFHFREKNHIVRAQKFLAPRLRHQIDTFGGPTGEHDLICAGCPEVVCHPLPRFFIRFCRPRTQLVQPTMDVGVLVLVITAEYIEHGLRLLRGRGVVEIDQWITMSPLAQDREIPADSRPIYDLTGNLVHILICSAHRSALLYSGTEFKAHGSHDLVLLR